MGLSFHGSVSLHFCTLGVYLKNNPVYGKMYAEMFMTILFKILKTTNNSSVKQCNDKL